MATKTLRLTYSERRTLDVEAEFPIYRKHDVSGDCGPRNVIYERIADDGTSVEIRLYGDHEAEISLHDARTPHEGSTLDYILGKGRYASSAEEFNAALARARALLDTIQPA